MLSFQCALESFSEPESSKTEQIDEDDSEDKDSDIGSDTFDDVATGILMEDATDIDEEWSDFESDGNSSGEFDGEINKWNLYNLQLPYQHQRAFLIVLSFVSFVF